MNLKLGKIQVGISSKVFNESKSAADFAAKVLPSLKHTGIADATIREKLEEYWKIRKGKVEKAEEDPAPAEKA